MRRAAGSPGTRRPSGAPRTPPLADRPPPVSSPTLGRCGSQLLSFNPTRLDGPQRVLRPRPPEMQKLGRGRRAEAIRTDRAAHLEGDEDEPQHDRGEDSGSRKLPLLIRDLL